MAPKNGYETAVAVLNEQMKTVVEGLAAHRSDTKEFREDVRRDLSSLRSEVIERADRHEESDRANFKAIDDRMVLADKNDATERAAQKAVQQYKKWQWGLIAGAATTILWNAVRVLEPLLHKLLGGQ